MNFDHILLIGYGAPSQPEEVMPYLRAMSEGRGVPEECLKAMAKHYDVIGGASPYNEQVANFKANLEKELHSAGITLPVFIAMKNWNPFFKDVLPEIHKTGYRRGLAIPLTPYRSAASGAGYKGSLEFLMSSPAMAGLNYQFIEGWYDQTLFIEAEVEEVSRVFQTIDPAERAGTPILFSFHSLPSHQDPANPMSRYAEEVRVASALVAEQLGHNKWTVVYQSRPISARTVWMSPEIEEEVRALAAKGEKRIIVVPLGFLCDHAEILYDLDHAVCGVIEKAGMQYLRAKTVLHHPKISALFKTLICQRSLN
ncbi:MAG: ferrochelatase [Omnitrophica bacterium RIFOXYB12_FULL_50_7]|nr:MAG: ferrochelatase [Omnitrophica bacterium RIFOXYB12_FULL_50_7]